MTICLEFDMSSFKSKFSWSTINFDFSLSYVNNSSQLTLLNSNISVSLKISKTTITSSGSSTTSPTSLPSTQKEASSSIVTYSSSYTNSSSDSFDKLNFFITYIFTVSNGLTEAKNIASFSGDIFDINATISNGDN